MKKVSNYKINKLKREWALIILTTALGFFVSVFSNAFYDFLKNPSFKIIIIGVAFLALTIFTADYIFNAIAHINDKNELSYKDYIKLKIKQYIQNKRP